MSAPDDDEKDKGKLSRRDFVKGAVATTVVLSVGCGEAPADADGGEPAADAGAGVDGGQPVTDAGSETDAGTDAGIEPVEPPEGFDESEADFPLGVASGDVTSDSAILWTRYAGAGEIELVVWEMDGDTYARTVHAGVATPREGFVHEDVALSAGRRYRYAFFVVEAGSRTVRSAIGRVRAAIAPDAMETLWLGAVSCTANGRGIAPLEHASGRGDLDAFLFLGDTTYNDGASSLAEYRETWDQQMSRPEYRALRGATSAIATWDDHEFDNNWDPETFGAARFDAAVQSFFDHQPLRRDAAAPARVWKLLSWGRTADIFVLDCRSERRPSTRGSTDEYISREQMDWLKAGLGASTAVFKLIVNSIPITDFPGAFDLGRDDRWEGYPTQREEILRHIDDAGISGVLWIAGDFHLASSQRVATAGPGATQNEILVGPGGQIGNPLAWTIGGAQFDFASTENNYVALELLPSMGRIRAHWINGSGSAFEVYEYDIG